MEIYEIRRNAAKCLKCGDAVESKSVHDFCSCSCGAMYVDGGHSYLRRGGDLDCIEELSEWSDGDGWHVPGDEGYTSCWKRGDRADPSLPPDYTAWF